jgi:hypothetical protein
MAVLSVWPGARNHLEPMEKTAEFGSGQVALNQQGFGRLSRVSWEQIGKHIRLSMAVAC